MKTYSFQESLFAQNLEVMRSAFKLEYNSMHGIGALLYTLEGRAADKEQLKNTRQILKSRHGIFSEFRGHLNLLIIVRMSLAQDPEAYLQGITEAYKRLSSSFILGDESRLLAAIVLHDEIASEKWDAVADRTMDIYHIMRKNHPLLTSQSDLPFAVLMAVKENDPEEQIRDVEECYKLVGERFHLSKDAVQTVSHILAMNASGADEKSARFLEMYEGFKAAGIKISTECMPILAILTNSDLSVEEAIRQTKENDAFLKTQKGFGMMGTGTGIRRLFAAGIAALCNTSETSATFGTISGTVLAIIIAIEIAVMVAVIASTTSASSSH